MYCSDVQVFCKLYRLNNELDPATCSDVNIFKLISKEIQIMSCHKNESDHIEVLLYNHINVYGIEIERFNKYCITIITEP